MPDDLHRAKSRERLLTPADPRPNVKPTDAERDAKTAPTSRFMRSEDSKLGAGP